MLNGECSETFDRDANERHAGRNDVRDGTDLAPSLDILGPRYSRCDQIPSFLTAAKFSRVCELNAKDKSPGYSLLISHVSG
jgi:hypothetical protein